MTGRSLRATIACLLCLLPAAARAGDGRGRAALLSLLVPGLGQLKMGDTRAAGIFFGVEGAGWLAVGTFRHEIGLRHDSQVLYAKLHARVDPGPSGGEYERDIGTYISSDEFNRSIVLFNAQAIYAGVSEPTERVRLIQEFVAKYNYSGSEAWRWDTNDNRIEYLRLLKSRLNARRNGNYALGLVVANHLLSAADALRPRGHAAGRGAGEKLSLWNAVPSLHLDDAGAPKLAWSLRF